MLEIRNLSFSVEEDGIRKDIIKNLNATVKDGKFIVITGNGDSPLAQEADICLCTGHPDEVCALGMAPTTSTTVMTVIGDILVVETTKRTGFTIEEYSKRHHGGYLGKRSREMIN